MEEKQIAKEFMKTNFGPEETEDYITTKLDLANQKKALLNQELKMQMEVCSTMM